MKFTNTEVFGWEAAIRGMRNAKNSWSLSDSSWDSNHNFIIGPNDMKRAKKLVIAGTEHYKFLRMIHVQTDWFAPRFIWSEADTYHFNTKNSTSTMHTLLNNTSTITIDMFEQPSLYVNTLESVVKDLEAMRQEYMKPESSSEYKLILLHDAKCLLAEGFIQLRTFDTNYAELRNMYFQRRHHRLKEWNTDFVEWVESLPYSDEFITLEKA